MTALRCLHDLENPRTRANLTTLHTRANFAGFSVEMPDTSDSIAERANSNCRRHESFEPGKRCPEVALFLDSSDKLSTWRRALLPLFGWFGE
jgi:hypothetical protein